ncbi:MAG: hypothetical protein JNL81_16665 [Hyphomonadaceae bacterium]|nr:hypothetical protein [Hyphomonadaceae bacterium]
MKRARLALIAAAAVLGIGVAAYGLGASAQPAPGERIVGYSVYAHSQYILLQRDDGSLRTCSRGRDSVLRRTAWECENQGTLPR